MSTSTLVTGWVVDYEHERVILAELFNSELADYNYYCPETHNYYNELDVFESEQAALEYYLGQIIQEKKECILYWDALDKKITLRLSELIR